MHLLEKLFDLCSRHMQKNVQNKLEATYMPYNNRMNKEIIKCKISAICVKISESQKQV